MISDILADFAVAVTLRRRPAGTTVLGRYVPASVVTSPIYAVITPATGKDLLLLPEGSRTLEVKRVLSTVALIVEPDADEILYRGVIYSVKTCADWADQGGFYDALMIKKENQA